MPPPADRRRGDRARPTIDAVIRDVHFAARMLRRSPGFTIVVVLTLALGVGVNAAMFTTINALLLRQLPYPRADRLVQIGEVDKKTDREIQRVSYPDFEDWNKSARSFEHMAAWHVVDLSVVGPVHPEQILAAATSPEFFETMGVSPKLGATLITDQGAPFAVISHGLFVRQFGADPSALGKSFRVGQGAYRVAGVAPPDFHFPTDVEVWFLERYWNPRTATERNAHNFQVVGRLRAGATLDQARVELDTVARRLEDAYPISNRNRGVSLMSLHEVTIGGVRRTLLVLMAATALLLLIACANVANLLLCRSIARRNEIAVRVSLGASRARVACQLITESVVLALCGGAAGLAAALAGVRLLVLVAPRDLPNLEGVRVDGTVLLFVLFVSLVAVIVFGSAPAWRLLRARPGAALGNIRRDNGDDPERSRLRGIFVISEFAMASVLLIGAGLLIKSLSNLQQVRLGFRPDDLLTVQLRGPYFRNGGADAWSGFLQKVTDEIQKLPGVEAAAAATELPVEGVSWASRFSRPGVTYSSQTDRPAADYRIVMPRYFDVMRIPIVSGRTLNDRDTKNAPAVVVINQAFAHRYFAGEDPVGREIVMDIFGPAPRQIVGVVGNVRQDSPNVAPEPEIYESLLQRPFPATIVVRTTSEPMSLAGPIRQAIWTIDREQAIGRVTSMDAIVSQRLGMPRFRTVLLALFAAAGAALAMIGVYGVLAYSVARRTHELGIRAALGASRRDALCLVLRHGLELTIMGVILGLVGAYALTRLLSSMVYGTTVKDPTVFITAGVLLVLTAVPACLIPAVRAASVDPMTVLRDE